MVRFVNRLKKVKISNNKMKGPDSNSLSLFFNAGGRTQDFTLARQVIF
jgi:hypothetical protein